MIVLPCLKLLPEDRSQEVCRASFCGADCETSKKPRGLSNAGSVGRDQIKGVNGGSKLPGIKTLEKFKKFCSGWAYPRKEMCWRRKKLKGHCSKLSNRSESTATRIRLQILSIDVFVDSPDYCRRCLVPGSTRRG